MFSSRILAKSLENLTSFFVQFFKKAQSIYGFLSKFLLFTAFGRCLFFRKPNFDNFSKKNFQKFPKFKPIFLKKKKPSPSILNDFSFKPLAVFERYDTDFKDLAYFCKENVVDFVSKLLFAQIPQFKRHSRFLWPIS